MRNLPSFQILILIFAEVLGLYGLIVALIMNSRAGDAGSVVCTVHKFLLLPPLTLYAVLIVKCLIRPKDVAVEGAGMCLAPYGQYPRYTLSFTQETSLRAARCLPAFYSHVLYCAYNTTFGRTACISTT